MNGVGEEEGGEIEEMEGRRGGRGGEGSDREVSESARA